MQEILLKLFSLGTLVVLVFCFIFFILQLFKIKNLIKDFIFKNQLEVIFVISLLGTVGSILLSIYFKLAPCELCWYQRIFLFPLPVIAGIALIRKDHMARMYMFALSVCGLVFAAYHSFLQLNLFKTDSVLCNSDSIIDCSIPAFVYFGFVTVPVMSFTVFLLLLIATYAYTKKY